MADGIEADLEESDALNIARDDVLQMKMEEERERQALPIVNVVECAFVILSVVHV